MKECEEEEKEVLIPLVKVLKNQEYCEWISKNDAEEAYLVLYEHEGLCWYHEGLIEQPHSIVLELSLNRVIEVNVDSHQLLRVNGEEVSRVEHAQVLNLNDDGERWEGDVLSREPYGWGVLYDKEGEKAYEGFRLKDVNVCYGVLYYSDVQKVEYIGEWFEGKRWGRGTQYDRNERVVFYGEWFRDEPLRRRVVLNEENQFLHSCIEELIVSNNSCNGREWSVLDLSFMSHLRLCEVGDECFMSVEEVTLIGLSELERVVIGKNSFTKHKYYSAKNPNRAFFLKSCERLRELKMGRYSFSDYGVCEIENVPSLEVIEMGELNRDSYNFFCSSLELKSDCSVLRMMNRLAQFEVTSVWCSGNQ